MTLAIHKPALGFFTQFILQILQIPPLRNDPAIMIRYADTKPEMICNSFLVKVLRQDFHAGHFFQAAGALLQQWPLLQALQSLKQGVDIGRHRSQGAPLRFRQLPDQGDQFIPQQARNQPLQFSRIQCIEQLQRHRHGNPVFFMPRFEMVLQRKQASAHVELVRKQLLRGQAGVFPHQNIMPQVQQFPAVVTQTHQPFFEGRRAVHVIGDAGVEKLELGMLIRQHIPLSAFVLEFLYLCPDGFIVLHECSARVEPAANQRFGDKNLSRFGGVKRCKVNPSFLDDHQAKQRDLLPGHHGAPAAGPVRIKIMPLE